MSSGLRWTIAVVLAVVSAALLTLTVVGTWAQRSVLDTDGFTAAVAPIGSDPAVQQAISAEATARAMAGIEKAVDEQSGFLAPILKPLVPQLQPTIADAVDGVVTSPQFATAWESGTRTLHDELVASFRGGGSGSVAVGDTSVTIDLALLKGPLNEALSGSRLASLVLDNVDLGSVTVPVDVPRLRAAVWVADRISWWTPLLGLLALVGAVLVAPRRAAGLLLAGGTVLAAAAVMLLLTLQGVGSAGTTLPALAGTLSQSLAAALDDGLMLGLGLQAALGFVLALGGGLWLVLGGRPASGGGLPEPGVGSPA